uniref:Uncharacterized protein n=1 Tax=Cacopsylla melanoneura TaxID=428564 RepID=A0A8D8Z594_9HEMI
MGSNLKPWVQVEDFFVKMEVVHDENRPGKVTKYKPKLFYDIETTKRNFAYPHGFFHENDNYTSVSIYFVKNLPALRLNQVLNKIKRKTPFIQRVIWSKTSSVNQT